MHTARWEQVVQLCEFLRPSPTPDREPTGQRISHAIVMTDALNIHEGTLKLKKEILQRRAA